MSPIDGLGSREPLIRVGDDFEDEYPGASALATECFANLWRAAELLMGLHNRHTLDAVSALTQRPTASSPSSRAPANHSNRA